MKVSNIAMATAIVALLLSPIEAGALEFVSGSTAAVGMSDDMIQTVQHRRVGGGAHVNRNVNVNRNMHVNRNVNVNRNINRNVHVNGYRPGVHPGYRPGYRPGGVVVAPRGGVWVGRPGWYRWAPGGAIAAGAAIGFATAAVAASWAGPPPQPGLCWYYTDPSRTQGFWDACP